MAIPFSPLLAMNEVYLLPHILACMCVWGLYHSYRCMMGSLIFKIDNSLMTDDANLLSLCLHLYILLDKGSVQILFSFYDLVTCFFLVEFVLSFLATVFSNLPSNFQLFGDFPDMTLLLIFSLYCGQRKYFL